jgi:hypothetical protein
MNLSDYVELNPRVPLVKGQLVPFISMDVITPEVVGFGQKKNVQQQVLVQSLHRATRYLHALHHV